MHHHCLLHQLEYGGRKHFLDLEPKLTPPTSVGVPGTANVSPMLQLSEPAALASYRLIFMILPPYTVHSPDSLARSTCTFFWGTHT
jgi:hypothetical protein